jgi:hypothetical protein
MTWGYLLVGVLGLAAGFVLFPFSDHLIWLWSTRRQRRLYRGETEATMRRTWIPKP